jgi:hypothetical protein|tara:strand:+ start:517 stop:900 length:384 start_codon:yes stop_codon:yes gene_type:complete
MKNTIKFLAILFSIFIMSCTVDDDILNVENNISEINYKTARIVFESNIDLTLLDDLSLDFNVQKTIVKDKNTLIWVMHNDYKISYLEDSGMFVDGVLSFDISDDKHIEISNGPGEEDDVEEDELERK